MNKDEALRLALEALTDALGKPMWNRVQMESAMTAIKATLANEALERKAENARELGLDYEPCCYGGIAHDCHAGSGCKIAERLKTSPKANEFNPDWDTQAVLTEEIQRMAKRIEELEAQCKPVAWMYEVNHAHTCLDLFEPPDEAYDEGTLYPLYLAPHKRKPLSDEEIVETFCKAPHQTQHVAWFAAGVRYAEATHGIKETA